MKIFVDMDGVLVDFVGSIHTKLGHEPVITPGQWDIPELDFEFWQKCDETFWATLPRTCECDKILAVAVTLSLVHDAEIFILTHAFKDSPQCMAGKMSWMGARYPEFVDRIIFTRHKHLLASDQSILIDDNDANISAFEEAGGHGILISRLWNSGFKMDFDYKLFVKTLDGYINEGSH